MLLLYLDCYMVWMWAIFQMFWRYMLSSSSGWKCVGWWICMYVQHCFENQWGRGGDGVGTGTSSWLVGTGDWESCADVPFKGWEVHTKFQAAQLSLSTGSEVAPVPTLSPHPLPPLLFETVLHIHRNSLSTHRNPEDEGSMFLWNIGNISHIYSM
jgi:hypothetical protein